jgi:MFS family permease
VKKTHEQELNAARETFMTKTSLLPPRRPLAFVGALLSSYQSDVTGWIGRLSTKYVLAIGFMIAGAVCILGALAVALAALFRWIDLNYGEAAAYAGVFGLLFVVGIIALLVGMIVLKRRTPAFPKGEQQVRSLTTTVNATADRTARIISARASNRPDTVTTLLAGSAAAVLAGWLYRARRRSARMDD